MNLCDVVRYYEMCIWFLFPVPGVQPLTLLYYPEDHLLLKCLVFVTSFFTQGLLKLSEFSE